MLSKGSLKRKSTKSQHCGLERPADLHKVAEVSVAYMEFFSNYAQLLLSVKNHLEEFNHVLLMLVLRLVLYVNLFISLRTENVSVCLA